MGRQSAPDLSRNVFRSRHYAVERIYFTIQKSVIEGLDDFAVQDLLQRFQIQDHPAHRVRLTLEGHLEHVVVPVPQWICSVTIYLAVLLRGPVRTAHCM